MFLHPYYVKYHVQCSPWFLKFDKISPFLTKLNWKSKTKLQLVFLTTQSGLISQVIVLHIDHLKFLHTYSKLAFKTCISLNYVHNTHCKCVRIQVVSLQDTAIWKVQCSQYCSAWGTVRVFLWFSSYNEQDNSRFTPNNSFSLRNTVSIIIVTRSKTDQKYFVFYNFINQWSIN